MYTRIGRFTTATLRLVTAVIALGDGRVQATFSPTIEERHIEERVVSKHVEQHVTAKTIKQPEPRPEYVHLRAQSAESKERFFAFRGKVLGETTTHFLLQDVMYPGDHPEWWAKRFCTAIK